MDLAIPQCIFQDRKIAYAVTDRALTVLEVGGAIPAFDDLDQTVVGCSLLDLVPELIGCEAVLADILAGELPRFQLAWVNRETATGQTLYLDLVELPCLDPAGQIVGLVHLVQDVSEMGALEQQFAQQHNTLRLLQDQLDRRNLELAAANAELQRLDELKSQFVSVAAHELRTPLSSILGYIEMLLDEDLGPLLDGQHEYLEVVQGAGRRLLAIVNDLLDVTRIEAGRLDLILRPTDLVALVKAVAAEYRPQVETKAQRLVLHFADDLPAALCDKARAAQVVGNLLGNASKYTPAEGQIAICVGYAREEGFLQVSVADTGIGISAEDQARLFSRFYRTAGARLSGTGGAGLGLHITRSLVELHGGRIWIESEPGKGSTFCVTFALAGRSSFET